MPLRSDLLARRLSTFDLPILPFLAPRVFQPWPSRGRRNFGLRTPQNHPVDNKVKEVISTVGEHAEGLNSRVWGTMRDIPRPEKPERPESLQDNLETEQPSNKAHEITTGQRDGAEPSTYEAEKERFNQKFTRVMLARHPKYLTSRQIRRAQLQKLKAGALPLKYQLRRRQKGSISFGARMRKRKPSPEYCFPIPKFYGNFLWYQQRAPIDSMLRSFPCRSGEWHRRFYIIARNNNPGFWYRQPPLAVYRSWTFPTELILEYINEETSHSLRKAWEDIPEIQRVRLWPELMLIALKDCPEKAMKVLSATYIEPYPDGRALSDCLDYIIWYYLRYAHLTDDTPALEIFQSVSRLLSQGPLDHVYLSQTSIFLLMKHLRTSELVEKLYRTMVKSNNPLHHNTLMQFADQLAKSGGRYTNIAYEIMEIIGDLRGINFNTEQMASLCTTLLMAAGENTNFHYNEVFEYMLKCGLRPDIIIYNVLIYKTLKAGESERGWQVYEMMKEHGIQPDAYTYSILMNDAKSRVDKAAITHITQAVNQRSLWSPHIIADALHSMFIFSSYQHRQDTRNAARRWESPPVLETTYFEQMLPVYCQYFRFEPLSHLIPGLEGLYKHITNSNSIPLQGEQLVDPQMPILIIMLGALLKSFNDSETPKIFYQHWKQLVKNNDPIVTQMSDQKEHYGFRHIYNLNLLALGQHASRIPDCLQIIEDMAAKPPGPPDTGDPDIYEPPPLHPPQPDVCTWSILVHIFQKHRQSRAAEKILVMMKERGVEPNKVTWTTLLHGYAKMQEPRMAIDVMSRMEKAGFRCDHHTLAALNQLRDRRALVEGMQRLEEERRAREIAAVEDIQKKVEEMGNGTEEGVEDADDLDSTEFVVKDLPTRNAYRDLNKSNTQWRIIRNFRKIDGGDPRSVRRGATSSPETIPEEASDGGVGGL